MMNMILSLELAVLRLGFDYLCCSASMSWDYIVKPTMAVLSTNVVGQVFVCFLLYLAVYAGTVVLNDCIKTTIKTIINAIQWLIDDMGSAFNAFLYIIVMIIGAPIFLVYDAVCQIYNLVYDFFVIEEDHLKIISVYTTVLQLITCPLWNITGFLIKKMMNAYAYIATADGSGSGSIPDLTPATPERRPRSASEYYPPRFYRRKGYTKERTLPVFVNDFYLDLDKFVDLEKKSEVPAPAPTAPAQPEVPAPAPTAPAQPEVAAPAPAQEPAPVAAPVVAPVVAPVAAPVAAQEPAPVRARITRRRRTFVTTVKSSTKRTQRWCMTNEENDDGYNELDRSRSGSRLKTCTDEEYFKGVAQKAFPTDEFMKTTSSRPFNNKETLSPASSSVQQQQDDYQFAAMLSSVQQQVFDDPDVAVVISQFAAMQITSSKKDDEMIIDETVEEGDDTYMRPQEDAIWDYIETAWEDDNL